VGFWIHLYSYEEMEEVLMEHLNKFYFLDKYLRNFARASINPENEST